MKNIIIAIDGFSACGKSTTARQVAAELGYSFIDTGAMYRAVSLYMIENQIDVNAVSPGLLDALQLITIDFRYNPETGKNDTWLNGRNVEQEIREKSVSDVVSEVAALSPVRKFLVAQQKRMGERRKIVMDGRDIGTVVFPQAELKIFMTATLEKRIERRMLQLEKKGIEMSEDEVRENLLHRDHIDSTREDSPLRQAEDAILLDNTNLTFEEQVDFILSKARDIIHSTNSQPVS